MAARRPGDVHIAFENPTRTIAAFSRMLELALDEVGLTLGQYRILGFCAHGPTTPTQVATWLSVKKQSVTSQLDALVEMGCLRREPDPDDRRRILHHVTDHGRERLHAAERAADVYLEVVLGTISQRDADSVRRGLHNAGRAFTNVWARARNTAPVKPLTGWLNDYNARREGDL